jgi:GNAT superfamily N-acetyltransferase
MISDVLSIQIMNTRPEHVRALAKMQRVIFPTLTPEELLTTAHYRKHLELFPDGQLVALAIQGDKAKVVGATTTFRTHFDFNDIQHSFLEVIDGGWLTHHDPDGGWLYGADLGILPRYRGMKIGTRLYQARRDTVKRLNLRGEIAGAILPGYRQHRHHMTVDSYVEKVVAGKLADPTLSMQLKNGFKVRGILYHYYEGDVDHHAALIVRENAEYRK